MAFATDGLGYLGYYFDALKNSVDMTPVIALLNRGDELAGKADQSLKSLGINLPTQSLTDRVLPAFEGVGLPQLASSGLQNLLDPGQINLSDLLPNFSGLNLENLFPGLTLPSNLGQNLKISHGVDPQTLSAWIKVDIVFDLDQPAEIFSFGPVTLTLETGHFESHSSLTASASGGSSTNTTGSIVGDWLLTIGSLDIVTFVSTTLSFDGAGHLKFNLDPQNIELNGLLSMVSDLVEAISGDLGDGFSLQPIMHDGIPVGIELDLDLPIPNTDEATSGIADLEVGASFSLAFEPDFNIGVGFNLSSEDEPFTITIFILGGAGWVKSDILYFPLTGKVATTTSLSIAVSASLGISLGPIDGFVAAYLGIALDFSRGLSADASGNSIALTAYLLIVGNVNVLGIITVNIEVRLAITYTSNPRKLDCRGTLSVSVKICWCFTLSVSVGVDMPFTAPGGGGAALPGRGAAAAPLAAPVPQPTPATYTTAAAQHLAMFE